MKISIYIWRNADNPPEVWRSISLDFLTGIKYNRIIFNHRFKEYRKNFKCTNHQLVTLIKKAKTMAEGDIIDLII